MVDASVKREVIADAGRSTYHERLNSVDAVVVSSRVDNADQKPEALFDGDLDTAWSSRTGDLAGAWIAFRLFDKVAVHAIELTVGMTKPRNYSLKTCASPRSAFRGRRSSMSTKRSDPRRRSSITSRSILNRARCNRFPSSSRAKGW